MTIAATGSIPILDLHTLGWKGFQDLCATLLAEVLGQTGAIFAPAHDAGRDGAFRGAWLSSQNSAWTGNFTVQCKHTASASANLSPAMLTSEYAKARVLASHGLADVYLLVTNHHLTATAEEEIVSRFKGAGVKIVEIYGAQWISQKIYETPRLRMLVPRIYGLGDLTQILDQRAYAQARSLLISLRDELRRFVPTGAYRKAAEAMARFRFCCLLGEPACGKSTIASVLCLHAIDAQQAHPIKVVTPHDFKEHWNPEEPRQLFWIDDVFGQTQYERDRTTELNHLLPELRAAINAGARAILTSRDYIYRAAMADLKVSSFPLLQNAQVVIEVEQLTEDEKAQILYNHIKLGNQPPTFRKTIKPHLGTLARRPRLLPEVARRLGDSMFTGDIIPTADGLQSFADNPGTFLVDTFRNVARPQKAFLALLYASGGEVETPISMASGESQILTAMGCNLAEVRDAAVSMDKSIVRLTTSEEKHVWQYRHPTMHDAFGALLAEDQEMLHLYLSGAKLEEIIRNVCCGRSVQGARVDVPPRLFPSLAKRLHEHGEEDVDRILYFLAYRSSTAFVRALHEEWPELVKHALSFGTYMSAFSANLKVLVQMHRAGVLSEEMRSEAVLKATRLAKYPDGGFYIAIDLFRSDEVEILAGLLRSEVLDNVDSLIEDWVSDFDPSGTTAPSDFVDPLKEAFRAMEDLFESLEDLESAQDSRDALEAVREAAAELEWEGGYDEAPARLKPAETTVFRGAVARDRFDDIDT